MVETKLSIWQLREQLIRGQNNHRFILLHGTDPGLASDTAHLLVKMNSRLNSTAGQQQAIPTRINASEIKGQPELILRSLFERDLFNRQQRVILIYQGEQLTSGSLHPLETQLDQDWCWLVVTAAAIAPRHPVRSWFTQHGLAVGCYPASGKRLQYIYQDQLRNLGLTSDNSTLAWLASRSSRDYLIDKMQLEKVALYAQGPKLHLADLNACFSFVQQQSIDDLLLAIIARDATRALTALHLLLNYKTSASIVMPILRKILALTKTMLDIDKVTSNGTTFAQAVASLQPPLFFQIRDALLRNAGLCSVPEINRIRHLVLEAERLVKSGRLPTKVILQRTIVSICRPQQFDIIANFA